MDRLEQRERARLRARSVRGVKLAGQDRYLARSRAYEPGRHFELWGSPCAPPPAPAPASPTAESASTPRP